MPGKRREKRRLGSVDHSLQRIQAKHKDHVWSCDFVSDKTEDGRQLRLLSIVDEYTRESLALVVDRRITAEDVGQILQYLFLVWGQPKFIRSGNGKLRDELLNQELFLSLAEARYVAERWRLDYNHHRPHSSLGWMTPPAFAVSCPSVADGRQCVPRGSATPHPSQHTGNSRETLIHPGI